MKKSIIYSTLFLVVLAFGACKEDTLWNKPNIELVPIYKLTDMTGPKAPYAVEIYKQKPLLIEFSNVSLASSYKITDYVDNSSSTSFDIMFKKNIEHKDSEGKVTITTEQYKVTGDKLAQSGTLTITEADGTTTRTYNAKVTEDEVYN